MNSDAFVLLLILEYVLLFLIWMKNQNNFQIAKVQPQGFA